jgi:hypothetical protein
MLEDNANSLFSAIDKLIVKDDRIYLLDITGPKSLLVFDMSGKFLHRVGQQGNGPGEYAGMINFEVSEDGVVLLNDYRRRNVMFYDKNGMYIKSVKSAFSFRDFMLLPGSRYLLSTDIYEKHNNSMEITITGDLNKAEHSLFRFSDDDKDNKLNICVFQPYRNHIAYMLPVSDMLYILDKEAHIAEACFFDFGNKKLPDEQKDDYEKTAMQRRKGIYYHYIYNTPIIVKQYIFASMFIDDKKGIAVFNRENGAMTYETLTPDNFSISNINFPLCAMNDSVIVSYLDSNLYDAIKDNFSVNAEIDSHLSNGGAILCLYKIK